MVLCSFLRVLDYRFERTGIQPAIGAFLAYRLKRIVQFTTQHEGLVQRLESVQHLMRKIPVFLQETLKLHHQVRRL